MIDHETVVTESRPSDMLAALHQSGDGDREYLFAYRDVQPDDLVLVAWIDGRAVGYLVATDRREQDRRQLHEVGVRVDRRQPPQGRGGDEWSEEQAPSVPSRTGDEDAAAGRHQADTDALRCQHQPASRR